MFCIIRLGKEKSISLSIVPFLIFLICSCAQTPITKEVTGTIEEKPAQIESINIISDPSHEGTMVEITSSKNMSYAAFKLIQPLRLVVDFNALPAQGLTDPGVINDRLIKDMRFEKVKERPLSTRLIATLIRDVEINTSEKERTVTFLLSPKKGVEIVETPLPLLPEKEEEKQAKEPRLFFSPSKIKLNQILGIDFYMLSKGKSRVTVTTAKKAEYDVSRKNSSTLLLEIMNTSIPSELTRFINSSPFEGAVNRITPIVKAAEKKVDLEIELKEIVPYHVVQTDKEIRLDFSKTSVKPPPKKLARSRVSKDKDLVKPAKDISSKEAPSEAHGTAAPSSTPKYEGEKMTLNFSNTDIRNLLKLIAEMGNKNIVWGDDVKGRVSMSLKNVPWDQALAILLEMNDLDKIESGNIIWVATKEKLRDLEKQQDERLKSKLEREKALRTAKMEAKEEVPLATDYITVNYVEIDVIKDLIKENVLGPRGKLSVDKPNKTIIMTDIPSNLEKAKKLSARQDIPVKQVMIEARIVEARESFKREMGVGWDLKYQRTASPWGGDGPDNVTYNFATNFTMPVGPTAGIVFANTTGTQVLNAQIALAETEGKVKTLSAPKIITRDTVEAIIKQGTTIYIPYTDEEGQRTAKEVEANLELKVTPEITPNNMVIMTIEVSDDYPDYANRVGENVPINTKSASTKMMVASGDTVVIGGIYKEDKSVTHEGIPWLSKVPILGWLFKTRFRSDSKSELLIFLKPTVLSLGNKRGAM